MSTVGIQLDLFGVIKREGRWYIAHCPSLDVSTQGKTLEEAKKNLIEACELFLISCLERGTLEQAFRELGVIPAKVAQPIPRHAFPIAINVPLALQRQSPCPA
jgi:predicted RNase H-like HicB family nuclease